MLYYRVSQKVSGNLEIVFGRLKTPGLAKILFLQNYLQDCNGYVHPHGIVADQSSIDQYGSLPSYWPRPWWCGLHVSLKYWGRPENIKLDYSQLENLEGIQNQYQTFCSQTKLPPHTGQAVQGTIDTIQLNAVCGQYLSPLQQVV